MVNSKDFPLGIDPEFMMRDYEADRVERGINLDNPFDTLAQADEVLERAANDSRSKIAGIAAFKREHVEMA